MLSNMRRSYRHLFPAVALLSALLSLSNTFRNYHTSSQKPRIGSPLFDRDASLDQCSFSGNPDIYGLGIRVGIYLQWFAYLLATKFLEERDVDIRDANTMFLLAIFIATAVLPTTNQTQTHAVEGMILLYIFFGGAFSVLFPVGPVKSKDLRLRTSFFGILLRFSLVAGMATYSVWFWFFGVKNFVQESCGTYVFLFAKVSLFGHALTFLKIAGITTMVVYGGLFLYLYYFVLVASYYSVAGIARVQKYGSNVLSEEISGQNTVYSALGIMWAHLFLDFKSSKVGREVSDSAKDPAKRRKERLNHLLVASFTIVWSILAIELTIRWNSITEVNTIKTTGQLIPFVIGIGGLFQVVYNIGKENAEKSSVSHSRTFFNLFSKKQLTPSLSSIRTSSVAV